MELAILSSAHEGVIAGCDKDQEWLLSWWWTHYSKHNSYPVAFVDFGLSDKGRAWCQERGLLYQAPQIDTSFRKGISSENKKSWEEHYGSAVWRCREIWFRKPCALLQSPFPLSVWLDLDCQVMGSIEPLFRVLSLGAEIGLRPSTHQEMHRMKGFISPEEVIYNCGVIAFRKEADILHRWVEQIVHHSEEFAFDQQALSRALRLHPSLLIELPPAYNWSPWEGENRGALINHFYGGLMKKEIEKTLEADS